MRGVRLHDEPVSVLSTFYPPMACGGGKPVDLKMATDVLVCTNLGVTSLFRVISKFTVSTRASLTFRGKTSFTIELQWPSWSFEVNMEIPGHRTSR